MSTRMPLERTPSMRIRIWGARGSTPTPCASHVRYGGNTACVELLLGDGSRLIFDAGTGIRELGLLLASENASPLTPHVFLTHFHWDHIQGIPFFQPLYDPRNTVTFHSPHPPEQLLAILRGQMSAPYFPIGFDSLPARVQFAPVVGTMTPFGEAGITPIALHHPQGSTGYRVQYRGSTFVYATDHEHGDAAADARLLEAAQGADVLFYDAQYTPEELPRHVGWGHDTWLEGTRLAEAAGVKQLVLFHHDPQREDAALDEMVRQARRVFANTVAAAEGNIFSV